MQGPGAWGAGKAPRKPLCFVWEHPGLLLGGGHSRSFKMPLSPRPAAGVDRHQGLWSVPEASPADWLRIRESGNRSHRPPEGLKTSRQPPSLLPLILLHPVADSKAEGRGQRASPLDAPSGRRARETGLSKPPPLEIGSRLPPLTVAMTPSPSAAGLRVFHLTLLYKGDS